MKQLSTYFEGLLSKTDKLSTGSSNIDKCNKFIEDNIKVKSYVPFTYSVSNKIVQFTSTNGNNHPLNTISAYHISVLHSEYGIEKLILNGNWSIRIDHVDCDLPVEIDCDSSLYIMKSYDGSRRSNVLKNAVIKSPTLNISYEVKIVKSIINSTTLIAYKPASFISNKIQAKNVVFKFSPTNKNLWQIILKTQVPARTTSSSIVKANWSLRDPDRIKEILHINPQEVFGLKKCNVNNIAIHVISTCKDENLLFTKNPKAFKSSHSEQYVMAGGWHALWVGDLKQFGL